MAFRVAIFVLKVVCLHSYIGSYLRKAKPSRNISDFKMKSVILTICLIYIYLFGVSICDEHNHLVSTELYSVKICL